MNGRRALALALLVALLAPVLLFAGEGEVCAESCDPGCGDCGLCTGCAVAPAAPPSVGLDAASRGPVAARPRAAGAPRRLPDPVPLARS